MAGAGTRSVPPIRVPGFLRSGTPVAGRTTGMAARGPRSSATPATSSTLRGRTLIQDGIPGAGAATGGQRDGAGAGREVLANTANTVLASTVLASMAPVSTIRGRALAACGA